MADGWLSLAALGVTDVAGHQAGALLTAFFAAHKGHCCWVAGERPVRPQANMNIVPVDSEVKAIKAETDERRSDIFKHVLQACRDMPDNTVLVVLDSVVPLLDRYPLTTVCRGLHHCSQALAVRKIVAVVHNDLFLHETAPAALDYLAATVIHLKPDGSCAVRHRRPSGKILWEHVYYTLDAEHKLLSTTPAAVGCPLPRSSELCDADPDPAKDLTFNLRLTDQSQRVRKGLSLPYEKPHQEGSLIYYEPDERDDFDGEDPDEDLDI